MNFQLSQAEAMRRAALSRHFAKSSLSANHIHDICRFGAMAHDALAAIRTVAEHAEVQGAALDPKCLLAFLADNQLMLEELPNAHHNPTGI